MSGHFEEGRLGQEWVPERGSIERYDTQPLIFGGRITLDDGTGLGWSEGWDYGSLAEAMIALEKFRAREEMQEPEGWVRHIPSYRRRPLGDAVREFVRE